MTQGLGIEPRPHWWEASALTTVPSLFPLITPEICYICLIVRHCPLIHYIHVYNWTKTTSMNAKLSVLLHLEIQTSGPTMKHKSPVVPSTF